jgi:glutaredoxin
MRKLILVVAIGVGFWYWDRGELPFMSAPGVFDENGDPQVLMFIIDNCGKACKMGRDGLQRRRVAFSEIKIDPRDDSDENVRLWKSLGAPNGFPLIVAGKEKIVGSGSNPEMVALLGRNFGDQYLTRTERRYFEQHFYADGSPRIVMYGADWCPYCKKLREEFEANDIDYIEIDVEKSGEQKRISETMGVYGYPTTWVGYARVNGTNLKAVNATLKSY